LALLGLPEPVADDIGEGSGLASGGQLADAGGGQEGYFFWGQPGESEKKGLLGAVGAGFLGG